MQNSKLIKILKTLSKEEINEFEKFAASPYFSRGRNLSPFLKILKSYYPEFKHEEFTNERIYKKLFPHKKFEDKNSVNILKTLAYELTKLCKEFLIYSDFKEDTNSKNFYLLNRLRQKKLYDEYEKSYKLALVEHSKSNGSSINDFIDKYFLQYTYNEFCVETRNYKKYFEVVADLDEIAVAIGLMRAYRGIEFKHLATSGFNLPSAHNFSESVIKNLDSKSLLEELKKNNDKYYPYIALNYMFYMISEYPDVDEYYYQFKKLVYENLNLFGHTEKYILFSRLTSYCAKAFLERPDKIFQKEMFDVYVQSLKLGVYKWSAKDDYPILQFRNTVLIAIDVNELDWVEKFIDTYSEELHRDDRSSMKHYSLAHLNYERKEYEKALENISKIKMNFPYYKLDIKNLMFKIYYDMSLPEQAFSILESLRHYISSAKELSPASRKKSLTFLKFSKELLKLKFSGNGRDVNYLLNEIKENEFVSFSKWLRMKVEELE